MKQMIKRWEVHAVLEVTEPTIKYCVACYRESPVSPVEMPLARKDIRAHFDGLISMMMPKSMLVVGDGHFLP